MSRRVALLLLLALLAAGRTLAQKPSSTELGFQPGKLYDFSEVDSVNLYNGNLMLTVPIGPRKQVSSSLSYQIQLVYNGKIWDYETWQGGCFDGAGGEGPCEDVIPNRRSNAGVGWRVSFGRLLSPFNPENHPWSTDRRSEWLYEGASGDEHRFGCETLSGSVQCAGYPYEPDPVDPTVKTVRLAEDASSLRLVTIERDKTYHVEFPSGETHRFERNGSKDEYRLSQINDQYGNTVTFTYEEVRENPRNCGGDLECDRLLSLTIADSTGASHVIHYDFFSAQRESVDRGATVSHIDYAGANNQTARYSFEYLLQAVTLERNNDEYKVLLPLLYEVHLPDESKFQFYYTSAAGTPAVDRGLLKTVILPTGGRTDYSYRYYTLPSTKSCFRQQSTLGISSRVVSDGTAEGVREWRYIPTLGPIAPIDYPDPQGDYCCFDDGGNPGSTPGNQPIYWVRTSVLGPVYPSGTATARTRTDHYFDGYSLDFLTADCDLPTELGTPTPIDPWAPARRFAFGYPGTVAAPPLVSRKAMPRTCGGSDCPDDVESTSDGLRLTTEFYSGCNESGDCSTGVLERSTYTAYEPHAVSLAGAPPSVEDSDYALALQLHASKTINHGDSTCDGECWTASHSSDNNGAGHYRRVKQTSNFPGTQPKIATTSYVSWSPAELRNLIRPWITGTYTEQRVQHRTPAYDDDVEETRELVCFDETGFLTLRRVLRDATATSEHDLLTLLQRTDRGDVAAVKHYGGDLQAIPTSHSCTPSLTGRPWYQLNSLYEAEGGTGYSGGIVSSSTYVDRTDGDELPFKSVDRTIDAITGSVLATRDTAGVTTAYSYESTPSRLESVKPTGGARSSYQYVNATDDRNAHVIETIDSTGGLITNTYEFDGLGRMKRVSKSTPNGMVAVTQTQFDSLGRTKDVSQPTEMDEHPFSDIGGYVTRYEYDALDRPTKVVGPDGSETTLQYRGPAEKTRTSFVATKASNATAAQVVEVVDEFGRLNAVTENSGANAAPVTTKYSYDVNGNLVHVKTTTPDGGDQQRSFDYDAAGLLVMESHPEIQDGDDTATEVIAYGNYDARGNAGKRTVGLSVLESTFDSAGRLTKVSDPEGPVKTFVFETEDGLDDGRLYRAIRHNRLPTAGQIDVTETYHYGNHGRVSGRTTFVESVTSVNGKEVRSPIQEFDYSVAYDDHLMPRTVTMPTCKYHGCSVDVAAVESVTNVRKAGLLTEVKDFAALTYHPSGMVESVTHASANAPKDVYSARYGLPRPSKITFTECSTTEPRFLPGFVRATPDPSSCGIRLTWPAATVCGGAGSVRYRVLRDGVDLTGEGCLTATTFIDATAVQGETYLYSVVAEGPAADGGTGPCQGGQEAELSGRDFVFTSCSNQTTLTIGNVFAPIGSQAPFRATLESPNGPLVDQELTFNLMGAAIGSGRTGPTGAVTIERQISLNPGFYSKAVSVTYSGGVFAPKTAYADLTVTCDSSSYTVKPSNLHVSEEAANASVLVRTSAPCSWAVTADNGFLYGRVSPAYPERVQGSGTFTASVPQLTAPPVTRETILWAQFDSGSQAVYVAQTANGSCSYRFSPKVAYIPFEGGLSGSIEVTTGPQCEWTVTSDSSWLRLEPPAAPRVGGGFVEFAATKNSGSQRTARLSINDGAATASVNQYGPPPVVCPELVDDLAGTTSVKDGSNVSLRVNVTGTYLTYKWYADGQQIRDCDESRCAALTLTPNQPGYPDEGESVTYQVVVENSCDGVISSSVTVSNAGRNCRVPSISNSTNLTNMWPDDRLSPRPGANVTLRAVADPFPYAFSELTLQWYRGVAGDRSVKVSVDDGGDTDEIRVHPTRTTFYWLEATSPCGSQISRTGAVIITEPPRSRRRVVRKDFSGDGKPDLVWQNTKTGQTEIWKMSGATHVGTIALPSVTDPASRLQSVGDVDDDGNADLIVRDAATGQNSAWLIEDGIRRRTVALEAREGSQWTIGALADLDNNYSDDIIWHNEVTGENEVWFQNGDEHQGTWALPPNDDADWGIYGAEDFNRDEKPDLFFYNRSSGESSIWLMDDAEPALKSGGAVASNATSSRFTPKVHMLATTVDLDWRPAQISDMNGDGNPDVIWRNVATGQNTVWLMDGTTQVETVALPPRTDLDWQIAGGGSGTAVEDDSSGPGSGVTLGVTAEPAEMDKATAVTAILTDEVGPLAGRELSFELAGVAVTKLLTDATGTAVAAIPVSGYGVGTHPDAIAVRFAGDGVHGATTTAVTLVVTASPVRITWANPSPITFGTPLGDSQLNATTDVAGSFEYSPASGEVLDAGYRILTATFTPADATRDTVTKTVALQVNQAPSPLDWRPAGAIEYGTPLSDHQLNATSSLSGSFAYEPAAGALLSVGNHSLSVVFTPDNANHAPASLTNTIEVAKSTPIIRWNDPAPMMLGEPLGGAQLNATVIVSGTEPSGVLTYDPVAGTILTEGVHELRVRVEETPSYRPATATVDVIITKPSAMISWSTPAAITYGTPLSDVQLNASATVAGTFVYTPPIGTVLDSGTHKLAVSFTPADSRYQPASGLVSLQVRKVTPVISWPTPQPVVYGTPLSESQLNATSTATGVFEYSPDPGSILDAGTHELTVRFIPEDARNQEALSANTTLHVERAPQVIAWSPPAAIVYGTPLSSEQLNAVVQVPGPAVAGAVTYEPPAGTILSAGPAQNLTIRVAATANYQAASASVTLDVLKATPLITWEAPEAIVYRTRLDSRQLNASADVSGAFTYSPQAGTLLDAGMHELRTQFVPSDSTNYSVISASVPLEVRRADPITAWARPEGIIYGTALTATQLNATADVDGTFVYTPPAGTILDAGTARQLSARFAPSDVRNYNEATVSTTLDVAKAPQTIIWSTPAPITYGQALSDVQLNAQIEVVGPAAAGLLTYAPGADIVLPAGNHSLKVAVSETTNYSSAEESVMIEVTRAPLSLAADAKTKLYGAPVPNLTGNLIGIVNSDPITAIFETPATERSVVGAYPITATLADPAHRLVNYDVSITPATLTVTPAPLIISAVAATKDYSDPVPTLSAQFAGMVLEETAAVLEGLLAIHTTADLLSPPGEYPISIGGVTSPNYAISFVGSTLTVDPEDARVLITSPTTIVGSITGPTEVWLSALIQDISASPDSEGDIHPGDIRKATLLFVDRASGAMLCSATVGLLDDADAQTGIASCSFQQNPSASLPATSEIGVVVGGYYVRDDASENASLQLISPTGDSITGGGGVMVGSGRGAFAPAEGTNLRFNINLHYDKKSSVSGKLAFTFVRHDSSGTKLYELSMHPASLAIARTPAGGVATIIGSGTLRDVTVEAAPVAVFSGAPMFVTATDAGEPSTNDSISVGLVNPEGGLWLASGWNGLQMAEQFVTDGNLAVHKAKK